HGIDYGDEWSLAIHEAVKAADIGLFVLSPRSVKSRYCDAEWNRILATGKKLYVAVMESVPLEDVPLRLGGIQYADLTADFDGKLADLIDVMGGYAAHKAGAPTPVYHPISGEFD